MTSQAIGINCVFIYVELGASFGAATARDQLQLHRADVSSC